MIKKFFLLKLVNRALGFAEKLAGDYNTKNSEGLASKGAWTTESDKKKEFTGEEARQTSMKSSQGKSDFSGSSYNGPGNVDREKRNSNMSQRNF